MSVRAENLGLADAKQIRCDFLALGGRRTLTNATLLERANVSDGAGGAGRVLCPTPAAPQRGVSVVGLELRRDGQTYSTHGDVAGIPLPFAFYDAIPPDANYLPTSGPRHGGTLINFSLPVANGSQPLQAHQRLANESEPVARVGLAPLAFEGALASAVCRVGDAEAPASVASLLGSAVCRTPAAPPGAVALQLALNGQDLEPLPPLPFTYYEHPVLDAVFPRGARPGTAVTLVGRNLGGSLPSTVHTCRFGQTVVTGLPLPGPLVVANQRHRHSVRCVVPARTAGMGAVVPLSVSLNTHDYTSEDVQFSIM